MKYMNEDDTRPIKIQLTTTDDYSSATAKFNITAPSGTVEERTATVEQTGTPPASTTVDIYITPDGTFETGENRIKIPVTNGGEVITYPTDTCEYIDLTVCAMPDVT